MAQNSAPDRPHGGIEALGDLRGRTVLVRSDLNVPLDGSRITDDGQILVDKSRKFQKELGQWSDVDSYILVG